MPRVALDEDTVDSRVRKGVSIPSRAACRMPNVVCVVLAGDNVRIVVVVWRNRKNLWHKSERKNNNFKIFIYSREKKNG